MTAWSRRAVGCSVRVAYAGWVGVLRLAEPEGPAAGGGPVGELPGRYTGELPGW